MVHCIGVKHPGRGHGPGLVLGGVYFARMMIGLGFFSFPFSITCMIGCAIWL